jgi:hypothetical protein
LRQRETSYKLLVCHPVAVLHDKCADLSNHGKAAAESHNANLYE